MAVSKNRGTPKSSILIGFSVINHPFWGTPIFGNTHLSVTLICLCLIGLIKCDQVFGWEFAKNTPPQLTDISPENRPVPKKKLVFQPSIFRCYVTLVSWGVPSLHYSFVFNFFDNMSPSREVTAPNMWTVLIGMQFFGLLALLLQDHQWHFDWVECESQQQIAWVVNLLRKLHSFSWIFNML